MFLNRILKSYTKVSTLQHIRRSVKTPKSENICPNPSPEIIEKKSIESRYEECEQLLRIKKFQKGYQTVKKVLKGEMPMSDVKSFMNGSYLKSVVIFPYNFKHF